MATDFANPLVRRLVQSGILDPSQRQELTERLQAQFPDLKELLRELHRRGWVTLYQIKEFGQRRESGLVLGSYVILEELGKGGNGQVFKARHQVMKRVVALKVVRPELLADAEVVSRFYREIEVVSQMAHPHIVLAYDAGPIGASLVLAMEYVDGIDLDRLVRKSGPLPVAQACDCIRQAALGLEHAHQRGLVHRDIKPSNLLLTKAQGAAAGGIVKILDLGLARLREPAPDSRTRNLTVLAGNAFTMGTPDYQAPEQAINFHAADIRADLYSLGCTFYYLLTGKPPFAGTETAKLLKHQQTDPSPMYELRPEVPEAVQIILDKLLAKLPVHRYQTPAELAQDLAALIATLPPPLTEVAPGTASAAIESGPTLDAPALDTPFDSVEAGDIPSSTGRPPQPDAQQPKNRPALFPIVGCLSLLFTGLFLTWWMLLRDPNDARVIATNSALEVSVTNPIPSPPTEAATPQPGLQYVYYQGNWHRLPNFETLKPVKTGTVPNFTLKERNRNEHFAFVFTGLLQVEKSGKHIFFLTTDDGGRVFIEDQLVVDDDGEHGARERSGAIELAAGLHPIKVQYFQATSSFVLKLSWQGPGTAKKQPIPDAVLFSLPPATTAK